MTNKENLCVLLKEFGVEFKDEGIIVRCETGMEKIDGYSGFFTEFNFDADGKFINMGAWE